MAELIRVDVCGPLAVTRGDQRFSGRDLGSRKARVLLALLTVEAGSLVAADRIHEALWPADPPADPGANVATLVSRLRRLLGDDVVLGGRSGYQLARESAVSDLDLAAGLVDEARARLGSEPATAVAAATSALAAVAGGEPVGDEPSAEWADPARRRAYEVRRSARHLLAESSTATGDHETAVRVATEATEADPFDEQAHRDLMRALVADGRAAAALTVHDELSARLRDELGVDPDEETRELHLAILRQQATTGAAPSAPGHPGPERVALIGREQELSTLEEAWTHAAAGRSALLLVTGEAGIGKTRLLAAAAEVATRTGAQVLSTRCHPGERSLFLQPLVDVLRPVLFHEPAPILSELLGPHGPTWATLVPELAPTVGLATAPVAKRAPDVERRQAYAAVTSLVGSLQRRRPLLIMIDDLQDAGAATIEVLGYLIRHLTGRRVLILVAARQEAATTIAALGAVGTTVDLGPLPPSAVMALAGAAGLSEHGPHVMARTSGHPLSVVESLRAIAAGDSGVPASLSEAILARVARLDPADRQCVEAAAVLGVRVLPQDLAGLLDGSELAAVERCRDLVDARLLAVRGEWFEFTNDLIQEVVLASLPEPLARAYHRRAADVLVGRPEAMAPHAEAAGDAERAALGWLLAGEDAMRRSAAEDARELFDQAVQAARETGRGDVVSKALLARSRAAYVLAAHQAAFEDIEEALELARNGGDPRLELAAELARGSDVTIALGRPLIDATVHLEAGLSLATTIGDRRVEAELQARLTVFDTGGLRLADALRRARSSLTRARASDNEDALVPALDGLKTVLAYLGDVTPLAATTSELIPLVRRRGDSFLLQWAVFESSFEPASRGDWSAARALIDEALELNARSGYLAIPGYFRAHRGWLARLAGDLPAALDDGKRSLQETSPIDHPWWYASAAGLLASTLVAAGRLGEAAEIAARGVSGTDLDRPEAYRLRCLAPLAAATGELGPLRDAAALLAGIDAPADSAWVVGADTYLDTAYAWLRVGEPDRARDVVRPLVAATGDSVWAAVHQQAELAQNRSLSS